MPVPPKDPNPPPSQGGSPQITTQDWNDLVDGAILKDRTTDQTLLSNLEVIGTAKRFIGAKETGYALRRSTSDSIDPGGIMDVVANSFDPVEGADILTYKKPDGATFLTVKPFGDSSFNANPIVDAVFKKPTAAFGSSIGHDTDIDQYVYGSSDLNELAPLYGTREVLLRKNIGFHEKSASVFAYGMGAPTRILEGTGAAVSDVIDSVTSFTQYTTGNVSGNRAGVQSSDFKLFRRQHRPNMGVVFRFPTTLTDIRLWIVITNADIGATDDPTSTHLLGIRFSSTTDSTIKVVSKNGVTLTVADFTPFAVSPVVNKKHRFYIFWKDDNTAKLVFRNGAGEGGIATVTATLPGTTINLGFQATLETKTAASKIWALSALKVEHV